MNIDQTELIRRMKHHEDIEREAKQLKLLYTNEAAAKSALYRENETNKEKLAKKREKNNHTKQ